MSRIKVSFEMDVHDYPHRNPAEWDWSSILEDDGVDIPDWSTLRVESVDPDGGAIVVGVVRYDFHRETIRDVYGNVSDDTLIEECEDLVEPESMEWKVYRP